MAMPFFKEAKIGAYLLKQKLAGRKRYPLVLMLEPLFRCNLACVGCGKIDYPDPILNQRLSVQECLDAVDECGAPMVAIPGGEPLIHREIGEIVKGILARKKFVSLCTNALLLEKKLHLFEPSPYLFFSVHLDGLKEHHDKSVSQKGVFDIAISAIEKAKAKGFAVNVNATIFDGHAAEDIAAFLDLAKKLGVGVSISPGYAYERAPDQEHFLNRRKTKELFRRVFALGEGKKWDLMHSSLFLDFLAGNREFHCTPWGMPTRNVFGWQKPCYLLGEGYVASFKELMETTVRWRRKSRLASRDRRSLCSRAMSSICCPTSNTRTTSRPSRPSRINQLSFNSAFAHGGSGFAMVCCPSSGALGRLSNRGNPCSHPSSFESSAFASATRARSPRLAC